MWIAYTEDRERLINQHGRFRPSFVHRDGIPATADGFATPRRDYAHYESRTSRVSRDRSDFAADTYKGNLKILNQILTSRKNFNSCVIFWSNFNSCIVF